MGLFDLPAPLLQWVDGLLAVFLPAILRLALWGVLAGWLTMILYRLLSNQARIGELKAEQKLRQQQIVAFDGELEDLLPLIRQTLALGGRQLLLALGPALLASLPVLFLVAWVSGRFGYLEPEADSWVGIQLEPADASLLVAPTTAARETAEGIEVRWPGSEASVTLTLAAQQTVNLPLAAPVPVLHQRAWWNWLFGNPLGYLEPASGVQALHFALPAQQFLAFGPGWMHGWMFTFFGVFLVASLAFKFLLKID